jgi:hypothetical protein
MNWIKCEPVFLDSVPTRRKRNRYCQCIGLSEEFKYNEDYSLNDLIKKLGVSKYYTLNTYHMLAASRPTIEFRIAENNACVDSFLVKNWVRLLLHFVDQCASQPMPGPYKAGDSLSGLLWLDPRQVMELLKFTGGHKLSKGIEQTRNWFLARLHSNVISPLPSVFSLEGRKRARFEIEEIIKELDLELGNMSQYLSPADRHSELYSEELKV